MRYIIRQKLFSLRDSFEIEDQHEQLAFTAKSQFFSFRKSFILKNSQEQSIAFIKQQLFTIKPKFELTNNRGQKAQLKKHFFPLFSHKFSLCLAHEKIEILGDLWAHEYQFLCHGEIIAEISKKWFSWSDTYGVDVYDIDYEWLIISSVIAIDCVLHDDKNSHLGVD